MLLAMSSKPNVWQSRIVGHSRVDPESLVANPHNFRKHPLEQRDALSAAISEVGFVRSVTVNKTTGNLVDGARRKLGHFGLDTFFERDGRLFGGFGDRQRDRDDVARGGRDRVRQELGWWDPSSVWVIGDTPLDVGCARAIDVRVLAVATGMFSRSQIAASRPDVLMDDLSQTERVVSILVE